MWLAEGHNSPRRRGFAARDYVTRAAQSKCGFDGPNPVSCRGVGIGDGVGPAVRVATLRVDRLAMRSYLRSRDVRKVLLTVDHLVANVAAKSAAVDARCRGAVGVYVAVEWADWVERDRETADRMGNYGFAVLQQG